MPPAKEAQVHGERPWLLIVFGLIGLAGCAALIAGTIIAPLFVPDYNWISDTISDLAAGRWEIIMDVALYGFAAGLMATALAASHAHLGKSGWTVGILSLAVLAALVIIIGARNEYGDKDNEGVVIHIYLVYGLGALFLLTCVVMQAGLRASEHPHASWWLIGLGALWAVLSPVFLMSPTGIDGLMERILGLIACAIVAVLCIVFVRRGTSRTSRG
ncbi:DUF998 domain-containing protein [Roseovarius sp. Pro17]|uniref:DUF998 domain-containing protein n=1 Tax=Roseovarius sp. Pro17 TaxID=3108175 RepID=UPI002D7A111A|nr:DUF998 domain-containing protein [Roseovarius sp. Pro17]